MAGILSILITLGRRGGWDGDGDGAVERVEWKHSREGGGENRTHKGRLKKAERIRGQIGPQRPAISSSWNYLVAQKFTG